MAKVRVYELARELGLESKEVLTTLKDMGEFVASASSTIEAPVVRRLRDTLVSNGDAKNDTQPEAAAKPASVPAAGSRPGAPKPGAPRPSRPAEQQAAAQPAPPQAAAASPRDEAAAVSAQAGSGQVAPSAPTVPVPPAPTAKPASQAPAAQTPAVEAPASEAPAPQAAAAPSVPGPAPSSAPRPGAARPGPATPTRPGSTAPGADAARPGAPAPGPRPPAQRPGSTGGLPAPRPRQQGAPRPGNNPFAPSQGMGTQRRPQPGPAQSPGQGAPRPGGAGAPAPGSRSGGSPRPGAPAGGQGSGERDRMPRPGGLSGLPRPNPAMMPKTAQTPLGAQGRSGGPGRAGGPGRPGGGRPGGGGAGRPGGAPGGAPNTGPVGGGRGGRGGRGGSGTQGAFGRSGPGGKRGRKSKKQRRQEFDQMEAPSVGGVRIRQGNGDQVRLRRGASLSDFAEKIGVDAAQLVQILFGLGEMVTATQSVPDETLEILGTELNYDIKVVSPEDEDRELLESFHLEFGENEGDDDDLAARPPVVTVMGHVDHGKTKLLDALRHSNVVAKEAGGITQAIGAYQVGTEVDGNERAITFIDTPGHEAFTAMRARGAKSTDIAVLVVAADDGVMPQTIEALNHAIAAQVPVVVAVNKVDKEAADPTKVRGQLTEYGLVPEEYGGDTMFVDVSAITGQGLDQLLEAIVLTADAALDLRANPDMPAQGVAIEAHLDKGRGPVATVLIHRGTLRLGDSIVSGPAHGRVRAMINDLGEAIDEAPPSMPVQVLGLTSVPGAGDNLLVVEDDRMARQIADKREARLRAAQQAKTGRRKTLDQLFEQMEKGEKQELLLILKGDSAGSVEALEDSLSQIKVGDDEVTLRVIDRGVGAITLNNINLAKASDAVILGFNVRAEGQNAQLADRENVDIRYYSIIYQAIDDIDKALTGMLKPIYQEVQLGTAEIRDVFKSSKVGTIAGCMVMSGTIRRHTKARLIRDGIVVQETEINTLRREKEDVTEVREGYECGITLTNFNDVRVGDIIETHALEEKARS